MELGTAGVPIDMGATRDYDAIFQQLSSAGIDVYFPTSIYEEFPVSNGYGYEADFVPPPFGSATPDIFDAARENGIKIAFSADLLFPLAEGGVDPDNSPLQAILDMGGADIIHSIAGYDEAAWNGIDPAMSQAVYEHVKALDPSIQVIQVHAPITTDDPTEYLEDVAAHGQWSDVIGFDVYPISGTETGARTPLRPDEIIEPGDALRDYMTYLQTEFPDQEHVMALQGFERWDQYPDSFVELLTPEQLALSRPPTYLEMREMLIAVEDADLVFWYGPSMLDDAAGDVWQNILQVVEEAANGQLGTPIGDLTLETVHTNGIDEDAEEGAFTGLRLNADDADAVDTVTYELDDDRFKISADGSVVVAEGAEFDFETETSVTLLATASSTDGSESTLSFDIAIADTIDLVDGSEATDLLIGADGSDDISAGGGDDVMNGLAGDDVINAGAGNDLAFGAEGDDTIRGEDGDDQIVGGDGDDLIFGGAGNDVLVAGIGSDVLEGGLGSDTILADSGNNTLRGNEGADTLFALTGTNELDGGTGSDMLGGGAGADTFKFRAGDGTDSIFFFDATMDGFLFEGLTSMDDLSLRSFGSTTWIDYDGGTITVYDVFEGTLTEDNFTFG